VAESTMHLQSRCCYYGFVSAGFSGAGSVVAGAGLSAGAGVVDGGGLVGAVSDEQPTADNPSPANAIKTNTFFMGLFLA
jgi:hypothetical protein